jgi:hypothetical protein
MVSSKRRNAVEYSSEWRKPEWKHELSQMGELVSVLGTWPMSGLGD